MSKKISLKQFLMRTGKFTRVDSCIGAIKKGRVTINGKIIDTPGYYFDPKKSSVRLNNEPLKAIKKVYFIMNKPIGYICQNRVCHRGFWFQGTGDFQLPQRPDMVVMKVGQHNSIDLSVADP